MKKNHFLTLSLCVAALMLVTSCSTVRGIFGKKKKKTDLVEQTTQPTLHGIGDNATQRDQFLGQVADNWQTTRFITSKVKFSVEVGNRQQTLTGNLKMKRDDVIRLQLMAFGFVEAGRLEFTKEYVLIVDRINKQYIKVPYEQLDFLRNSKIDFFVLQALFWNEVFKPGTEKVDATSLLSFTTEKGADDDVVIALSEEKMSYRWLTDNQTARVKMANILYSDRFRGNYQLNWDYGGFKRNDRKYFPTEHKVTFDTPKQKVKFDMILNYMGNDEEWETRTVLTGKYRQVPVDEILRRFMTL